MGRSQRALKPVRELWPPGRQEPWASAGSQACPTDWQGQGVIPFPFGNWAWAAPGGKYLGWARRLTAAVQAVFWLISDSSPCNEAASPSWKGSLGDDMPLCLLQSPTWIHVCFLSCTQIHKIERQRLLCLTSWTWKDGWKGGIVFSKVLLSRIFDGVPTNKKQK